MGFTRCQYKAGGLGLGADLSTPTREHSQFTLEKNKRQGSTTWRLNVRSSQRFSGNLLNLLDRYPDFAHDIIRKRSVAQSGGHFLPLVKHPVQEVDDDFSFGWLFGLNWD